MISVQLGMFFGLLGRSFSAKDFHRRAIIHSSWMSGEVNMMAHSRFNITLDNCYPDKLTCTKRWLQI